MKISELLFITFLIPATLMGFTLLGIASGNLNDDGMLLRAALVSAVPAATFSIAGLALRRKAADSAAEQTPGQVMITESTDNTPVRSAA